MQAQLEPISLDAGTSFRMLEINSAHGFDGHWHFHPECELTWIREGEGQRVVGDHLASFSPRDLVLLASGLPHFWRTAPGFSGRSRALVIQFQEAIALGFEAKSSAPPPELRALSSLIKAARRGLCFSELDAKIEKRFASVLASERGSWGSFVALMALLGELADRWREGAATELTSLGYRPQPQSDQRLARVYRYVFETAERFGEAPSFAGACAVAAMTPAAFSRFFKRQTGRTFSQFVNETKIARACRRLQETDDTILTVALESGFGSLSHFNRVFASLKDCSPGSWRRRLGRR